MGFQVPGRKLLGTVRNIARTVTGQKFIEKTSVGNAALPML